MGRQSRIKRARRNLRHLLSQHRAAITDPDATEDERMAAIKVMHGQAIRQYARDAPEPR